MSTRRSGYIPLRVEDDDLLGIHTPAMDPQGLVFAQIDEDVSQNKHCSKYCCRNSAFGLVYLMGCILLYLAHLGSVIAATFWYFLEGHLRLFKISISFVGFYWGCTVIATIYLVAQKQQRNKAATVSRLVSAFLFVRPVYELMLIIRQSRGKCEDIAYYEGGARKDFVLRGVIFAAPMLYLHSYAVWFHEDVGVLGIVAGLTSFLVVATVLGRLLALNFDLVPGLSTLLVGGSTFCALLQLVLICTIWPSAIVYPYLIQACVHVVPFASIVLFCSATPRRMVGCRTDLFLGILSPLLMVCSVHYMSL